MWPVAASKVPQRCAVRSTNRDSIWPCCAANTIRRRSSDVLPVPASFRYLATASCRACSRCDWTRGQVRLVQFVFREMIGIAGDFVVRDVRVTGDLAINRQQVLDAGEDQGGPLVPERVAQGRIDDAEVLRQLVLGGLAIAAQAVNHGGGFSRLAARCGMGQRRPLAGIVVQGLGHVLRQSVDLDLLHAELPAFEETDAILTERQDKVLVIHANQRQERFDLKPPIDHDRLIQRQGNPEAIPQTFGNKHGQSLAAFLPEAVLGRQDCEPAPTASWLREHARPGRPGRARPGPAGSSIAARPVARQAQPRAWA